MNLTKKEFTKDAQYLFKTLEETHPDLFFRCSKARYLKEKNKLLAACGFVNGTDEFRIRIKNFLGRIHDGHTRVDEGFSPRLLQLPMETRLIEDRLFVVSAPRRGPISIKDEVLSVNGVPVLEYLRELAGYRSCEIYKEALNSAAKSFPYKITHREAGRSLALTVKKSNGKVCEVRLPWGQIGADPFQLLMKPFEFRYIKELKAGYLNWRSFFDRKIYDSYVRTGIMKCNEHDRKNIPLWEDFLQRMFSSLINKKAEFLIIDLRNNRGGSSLLGNNLVSFLTKKPIRDFDGYLKLSPLLHKFYGKKLGKAFSRWQMGRNITQRQLRRLYGHDPLAADFKSARPPARTFKGKVIVLTGWLTYSAAETFAALIKDNNLGLLIGEPCGNGSNGPIDSLFFELPNSRINVSTSFAFRLRPDPKARKAKSLRPDIMVSQTVADFLKGKDTVMEYNTVALS